MARRALLTGNGCLYRKRLSPHFLRHTFGILTVLGGAGLFRIQEAMDHAEITVTCRKPFAEFKRKVCM